MKKFSSLILLLSFASYFGQKKFEYKDYHLPVKYIVKNSNDTISTRVIAQWSFKKNHFYPTTYLNKITIIDEFGKKTKIAEELIDYMEITDFDGQVKKYRSSENFSDLKDKKNLLEILYEGNKIGYYLDFYTVNIYGNVGSTEYVLGKNGTTINSLWFSGKTKKMKELFKEYPELYEKFERVKTKEDFISVLKEYDAK
ncbi:hypothetical protein [Kaistella carnis]|uniref:hypothetical protein n=1 Tax=Kaistella carnis TaxID=1241979 RepID=UPI0028979E45|nr:hypothetical protein [Kaistella carnis]